MHSEGTLPERVFRRCWIKCFWLSAPKKINEIVHEDYVFQGCKLTDSCFMRQGKDAERSRKALPYSLYNLLIQNKQKKSLIK